MRESVRGRSAALATVHIAAARFAREEIKRTDTLGPYAPPNAPQRIEGLEQLAKALEGLAPQDQRTYALSLIQSYLGGDSSAFTPGEEQALFFSALGLQKPPPLPDEAIDELIALGIEDVGKLTAEANRKAVEARARVDELDPLRTRIEELERELEEQRAETRRACDAEQASRDQLDYLKSLSAAIGTALPDESSPGPSATPEGVEGVSDKPRRRRVEGHTGVYRTPSGSYEIGYADPETGKQRWKVIGPDLDAAIEARRKLTEREAVPA